MEDFSNFIHEEIYILKESTSALSKPEDSLPESAYKMGVVTGDITDAENVLLGNILTALKLEEKDILRSTEVQIEKSTRWVIFASSLTVESVSLEFYQPTNIKNTTIVLAHPLSILLDSQKEKQNLWKALKEIFDLSNQNKSN